MRRGFGHALLLFVCVVAPARAGGEDPASVWLGAKAEATESLAALARKAHARKLFLTRDGIYGQVLAFDSDHAKARSWLKYVRRDGRWVRSRYSPPHDRGGQAARERQAEEEAAWRAWWRQEVIRVHGQAAAAGASSVAAEILRFALAFQGEDPAIRKLAGEAPWGEGADRRWILHATERGLATRARLLEAARAAARAVAPPVAGTLLPADRPGDVAWSHVLAGETVRVVGGVGPDELRRHHQIAASAAAVFSAVFSLPAELPLGDETAGATFPLYVASGRAQGNAFLAKEPGIDEGGLALLAGLDLAFFPERPGALVKTEPASLRREATVHAVQAHLTRSLLGHRPGARGAWAQESVALYLVWLQVRTRKLCGVRDPAASARGTSGGASGPFGRPRRDGPQRAVDLEEEGIDWHVRAAEAIRDLTLPELIRMSGKPAGDLDALDLLAGYGIAVYVLEARPDVSVAFFRGVAAQTVTDLDAMLEAHLGTDLETLRPHLLRWLDEMGELAPPPGEPR